MSDYSNNYINEPVGVSGSITISSNISCNGYCDGELIFSHLRVHHLCFQYKWIAISNSSVFGNLWRFIICNYCKRPIRVYTSVIFLNQPSEFSFQTDVQKLMGVM